MKTEPYAINQATNRVAGFNKTNPSHERVRQVISLVWLFLAAFSGTAVAAAATYKLFGREVGGYTSKDDLPAIVKMEL